MRTTITLDSDVELLLKRAMKERGMTFKEAVNSAIRRGLGAGPARVDFHFPTFDMGEPQIVLDRALQVAAQLEDEEIARDLAAGR